MSIYREYFQEACKLNNSGVHYLICNDAGAAVKAFKSALSIMELISNDDASEKLILPHANYAISSAWVDVPDLQDPAFFVYNRAILFDLSSFSSSEDMDLLFANAAIMFNLALVFHRHGQQSYQVPLLRRAGFMYGRVVELVGYITNNAHRDTSFATALAVVAMNNQAQILHSDFVCEYSHGRVLLERVRVLSEQVTPLLPKAATASTGYGSELFDRRQFDEIYLNVALVRAPTTASCA